MRAEFSGVLASEEGVRMAYVWRGVFESGDGDDAEMEGLGELDNHLSIVHLEA